MTRIGDRRHADERHQHAGKRELAAAGRDQRSRLAVNQRRNQRAHHQRNANGHANAQRHSQVAHGEPVADVAHAPHRPEQRHLQQKMRSHRGVKALKIRQQKQAHANRQQYPGEQPGHSPGGLPRPSPDLPNGRVERRSRSRAQSSAIQSRQQSTSPSLLFLADCTPQQPEASPGTEGQLDPLVTRCPPEACSSRRDNSKRLRLPCPSRVGARFHRLALRQRQPIELVSSSFARGTQRSQPTVLPGRMTAATATVEPSMFQSE